MSNKPARLTAEQINEVVRVTRIDEGGLSVKQEATLRRQLSGMEFTPRDVAVMSKPRKQA